MPEYDIDFAAKLASIASEVDEKDPWAYDARRVTIYLARLSAEISMKALLEKAGVPIPRIRARSHNLRALLTDLSECEVEIEIASGIKHSCSASLVRSATIDLGVIHVPIGEIIDAEDPRISKYPNEIRYGESVVDFSPALVSGMAVVLANWAKKHWKSIRVACK